MTLSFKDFMVTPVEKGEDEYQKYRAHKRRRGQGAGSNAEYASTNPPRVDEQEETDEALSMSQRLAKSRQMKRYKTKIKVGRERAMRKTADMGRIKKRNCLRNCLKVSHHQKCHLPKDKNWKNA